MAFVESLFPGSIDIIGDVHGEWGALQKLLAVLGYNKSGVHPEGRRLVFVGDLIDRGPASITVTKWIQPLLKKGLAQCIAGNHELNILRSNKASIPSQMRHGNHWYYGQTEALDESTPTYKHVQELATLSDRDFIHDMFQKLPLILEDKSYRVVHACWTENTQTSLLACPKNTVLEAYEYFAERVSKEIEHILNKRQRELLRQNNNPVKLCTSGIEMVAEKPYHIKGKLRHTKRVHWWKNYAGGKKIIFGHYWRKLPRSLGVRSESCIPPKEYGAPDPFDGTHYDSWLGESMCIDYSVGGRYYDRQQNIEEGHSGKCLCALRITRSKDELGQHELLFDTGQRFTLKK
jgi:hypothetical protein